jgi:prevent-host-death family protein
MLSGRRFGSDPAILLDQLDQLLAKVHNQTIGTPSEEASMAGTQVNLYEAKTQLSSLVERASKGEEIIIAKAGKPMAVLTPIPSEESTPEPEPLPFGQNLLGITFLSEDWEEDLPESLFENADGDKLLLSETGK